MVLITGACSYGRVYFNVIEGVMVFGYEFEEVSGHFRQHNFGRGGAKGDAVIANVQDGFGFNNANFMIPPDGQNRTVGAGCTCGIRRTLPATAIWRQAPLFMSCLMVSTST